MHEAGGERGVKQMERVKQAEDRNLRATSTTRTYTLVVEADPPSSCSTPEENIAAGSLSLGPSDKVATNPWRSDPSCTL
jgi:hypothetical protein